ncbi:rRNA methyltransferase [Rhodothalassium salexigens]|uniref:RNA methyltransferase n=1 Tax=Rhodothalassium salexigens TaxID=1086 RepID=UPI0019142008|nr:RNA methyltransferase [Rhodothalassium salexigens]MBK5912355.1 rRNA methyltransferase [Rhodothalassium salexigens]MBK5921485.1 rRNA methyltransferase [Rhodothalassium salexigens]
MAPAPQARPIVVLVRPQLGENIGKTARAMYNFGLTDLVLVAPRDGWPNPAAGPAAAGADVVLDRARVVDNLDEAVGDCSRVFATTVRDRGMVMPVVTPLEAAAQAHAEIDAGGRVALVFGPERSGLSNEDLALADTILTVPVNPAFGSLNLAQAVVLVAYEWFQHRAPAPAVADHRAGQGAPKQALADLHAQLVADLDARGYFRSEGRYERQARSLRTLLENARLTDQEVQTLRGVFKTLTWAPRDPGDA